MTYLMLAGGPRIGGLCLNLETISKQAKGGMLCPQ